jgi:hypothetical protein
MRPQTKGFAWGVVAGVVATWALHAVYPGSKAIGQRG